MKYRLSHLVMGSLGERTTIHVQEVGLLLDEDLKTDFLRGEIQFTRVNRGLYAQGHLQTQVQMTCVRCLEPFSYPLEIEMEERYVFSRQEGDKDPVYLVSADGMVDIAEPVRQQIWVSLPLQPLCRPDCQGLCPHCGTNLNNGACTCQEEVIDPRLVCLKDLL